MSSRPSRGFTLIEMLTALLIMALLAVAGYRGLNAVLQSRAAVAQETRKWQQLMLLFAQMEQDVAQALRRPVRDRSGNQQPEWLGLATTAGPDDAQLAFTRAGTTDEGEARQVPQRIGYRLDQDTIQLLRWPALDQPQQPEVRHYPLLSGVREFNLRYLAGGGTWVTAWPPPGQPGGLPAALEVGITLTSGEAITRVFALQ